MTVSCKKVRGVPSPETKLIAGANHAPAIVYIIRVSFCLENSANFLSEIAWQGQKLIEQRFCNALVPLGIGVKAVGFAVVKERRV